MPIDLYSILGDEPYEEEVRKKIGNEAWNRLSEREKRALIDAGIAEDREELGTLLRKSEPM